MYNKLTFIALLLMAFFSGILLYPGNENSKNTNKNKIAEISYKECSDQEFNLKKLLNEKDYLLEAGIEFSDPCYPQEQETIVRTITGLYYAEFPHHLKTPYSSVKLDKIKMKGISPLIFAKCLHLYVIFSDREAEWKSFSKHEIKSWSKKWKNYISQLTTDNLTKAEFSCSKIY